VWSARSSASKGAGRFPAPRECDLPPNRQIAALREFLIPSTFPIRCWVIAVRQRHFRWGWNLTILMDRSRARRKFPGYPAPTSFSCSLAPFLDAKGSFDPKDDFGCPQLTLEPTKVIASPSTTPRKSLPLFTTTKCAGITPRNVADTVQSAFTV
jgi:hypothetical protein